jgi:hypothetical protein
MDHARVAQLVEHAIENRSVGGSTPSSGTTSHTDIANEYTRKLALRVFCWRAARKKRADPRRDRL